MAEKGTSLEAAGKAEERISHLEGRSEKITQNVAQRGKELENKTEQIRGKEDRF